MELVGAQEIGCRLGVSRQRVQQLIAAKDFPPPVAHLAMGKVWLTDDIRRWCNARGRAFAEEGN